MLHDVKVHPRSLEPRNHVQADDWQCVCVTGMQHHRFAIWAGLIKQFHQLCFDLSLKCVAPTFDLQENPSTGHGEKNDVTDKEEQSR